ncbi:MAG: HEPN domain-containing protein [Deltaproteobacteria bacterium]|nr:HEPN domain-containing protein [Deltaproteobacteria bacterium]
MAVHLLAWVAGEARAKEGRRWLGEARAELAAARVLAVAAIHHLACFHAQQAAEKALKAFLYAQGEAIVLGHSVHRLRVACERYDASLATLADLRPLDGYYVPPRYPNGVPPDTVPSEAFSPAQSSSAASLADDVIRAIAARVGG